MTAGGEDADAESSADDADESRAAKTSPPRTDSSTAVGFHAGEAALLVDAMLGTLVTYLRMCGYDAAFVESDLGSERTRERDAVVRERALAESRTILTRDRALADATEEAILLETRDVEDQLRELHSAGFELCLPRTPDRCGTCNATLTRISPAEPTPAYAPAADEIDVWRCPDCGQHFWKGSHWDDVAATLAEIR